MIEPHIVTRSEHIEWCKQRALQLLETGDTVSAITSIQSDLRKHPATGSHLAIEFFAYARLSTRNLTDPVEVRYFIEAIQ